MVRRSASPISAGVTTGFTLVSGSPGIGQAHYGLGEKVDEVDRAEHVVAHRRLGFRHLVGNRLVTIAVALEDAAGRAGRQPGLEAHLPQREAAGLVALPPRP